MYLHQQMDKAVHDAANERLDFLVVKVLTMLSDRTLRTAAAGCLTDSKQVALECNFIDQVWEDPRVERRVQALARQGITVARETRKTEVAGQSYERQQVLLTF